MQPKKILVTGGLGFIGHQVVRQLEAQGHRVYIVDSQTSYGVIPSLELSCLLQERWQGIKSRYQVVDICDQKGMDFFFNLYDPDIVIHLAGFPRQKTVDSDPLTASQTMSAGLINMLEHSARFKVEKFVYISSSMVYGDFKSNVTETAACNPKGQYGILKLAGESLVKDYARRHDFQYTILRPSAVYGPLDIGDRVVATFLLTALRNGAIKVNGESEELDFTYVTDTAAGIVGAALSDNTGNKTYNITRGHSRRLLDAAQLVLDLVGYGRIEIHSPDQRFPRRGMLNIDAARTDFDFNPQTNIEQGFEQYYAWIQDRVHWYRQTI